jgi:hypothetical protein
VFDVPGHGQVRVWFGAVIAAGSAYRVTYSASVVGAEYEGAFDVPVEHVSMAEPLSQGVAAALADALGFRFDHPWLCEYTRSLRAFDAR